MSNILIRYSLSPRVQDLPDSVKHTLRKKRKCLWSAYPDFLLVFLIQILDMWNWNKCRIHWFKPFSYRNMGSIASRLSTWCNLPVDSYKISFHTPLWKTLFCFFNHFVPVWSKFTGVLVFLSPQNMGLKCSDNKIYEKFTVDKNFRRIPFYFFCTWSAFSTPK